MSLAANFRLRRGTLDLAVELEVESGETLAVVGPNGAGKSTLLFVLAGLLRPSTGEVRLGGRVLQGAGTFLTAAQRPVGFVFQDSRLFPHISAADNVAFGLRARGASRRRAREQAESWLRRVGLAGRGGARPSELSGGEAQRVALARALATAPELLLLDEPLAAVDASGRTELRRELRARLTEFAGVRLLVTHAAVDAFSLADRVAVLEGGRILQVGTAAAICERPRSRYVADLVGLNLFEGTARGGVLELAGGGRLVIASASDGPTLATVHPRAVSLFRSAPQGSPRNVWKAALVSLEATGDRLRLRTGGPVPLVAEITQAAFTELGVHEGDELWVAVKATEISSYPA